MDAPSSNDARILVLEPEEQLASAILSALRETAPTAVVDVARSLEEAQPMTLNTKPDLFVLDVDATYDLGQEFLLDLRTSHPHSRAIILTATHLSAARERAAGLGAIHFLEKPFPHNDFVDLVQALLRPSTKPESEKFQGTLSDLHMADIIQLKCMSGTTAAIQFTGPTGEKGRIYFENGQVRHASAPGHEGVDAFNEIVTWKGGMISELAAGAIPRTINLDWQILLMEAMRKEDESGANARSKPTTTNGSVRRKVLVIDDSVMLLNFVKDILTEGGYDVTTAPTAHESLAAAKANPPELILLDYVLPDMRGDEVTRRLREDSTTAKIPVIYMSGLGTDLRPDAMGNENVIGSLNKPFTSDLLIKTVESHMPKSPDEPQPHLPETEQHGPEPVETVSDFGFDRPAEETEAKPAEQVSAPAEEWWSPPPAQEGFRPTAVPFAEFKDEPAWAERPINQSDGGTFAAAEEGDVPNESVTGGAYFCGDTRFFSLNWALQTIAKGRLTGKLRSFWNKEPIDLFTKDGEIVLATTNDPELYCAEAPITLANVDQEKIAEARAQQRENGCPIFITLAKNESILQEPSLQLVQHYGQKLFAHLWSAPRVRFMFEQGTDLPEWAGGIATEGDVDHWALATLRLIQFQDLGNKVDYDSTSIPAYTRDGFDRVQNLRLTVAEAQFASQFNGVRSIQQIAKNLRLDLKFARLTLFRFIALEIVECWPAAAATKPERTGMLHRLTRSIGIGD